MSKDLKITNLQHLINISNRGYGINLIFLMKINIKAFFKLIPSLLVSSARHAKPTQNNKCAKFLKYLKKEGREEVDFLHADKLQIFVQVDAIFVMMLKCYAGLINLRHKKIFVICQSKAIVNNYFYMTIGCSVMSSCL